MRHRHLTPQREELDHRVYLGDGAYVGRGQWDEVHLWTTDGVQVTNNIVLGSSELALFEGWLKALRGS